MQAIGEAHFGPVSRATSKKTKKTKAGTNDKTKAPCFSLTGYRFGLLMALCAVLMPIIIHATCLLATVASLPDNDGTSTESMSTQVRMLKLSKICSLKIG